MSNAETQMTLDDAVSEVLNLLTGLDLHYQPELDRYQSIVRYINRACRLVALEKEWSFFSTVQSIGNAVEGERTLFLPESLRPRVIGDDAVRLVDYTVEPEKVAEWAYFLPRDALHKYESRAGLWAAVTNSTVLFSRPFTKNEDGLDVQIPVMREPLKFRLPAQPEDPLAARVPVDQSIRDQLVDFPYPDLIILKAAAFYARSNPVMQPRAQDLDAQYKDVMYQIIERDDRNTDSPYMNEFLLPVQGGLVSPGTPHHPHPHSDERRR